jgi:hypothetical protein
MSARIVARRRPRSLGSWLVVAVTLALAASLLSGVAPAEAGPAPSLRVTLASDATPDGTFHTRTGHVGSANDPVAFRVELRTGTVPLVVEGIEFQLGGHRVDVLAAPATDCDGLLDVELAGKARASCDTSFPRLLRTYGGQPRSELDVAVVVVARDAVGSPVTASAAQRIVNDGASDVGVELLVELDADGDGIFNASEAAAVAGGHVTFQLTVRNSSHGRVVLQALTHRVRGQQLDLIDVACPALTGVSLRGTGHDDEGGGCGGHDDGDDGGCGGHDDGDDGGGCGGHEDDGDEGGCGGHEDGDDHGGTGGSGGSGGGSRVTEVSCTFTLDDYGPTSGRLVGRTEVIVGKGHGTHAPSARATARTVVVAPAA